MIAGVAPGGGLDTICRAAAQMLTEKFGQTFIVDNRPGGGTVLAMDVVAQATPDGYTLLCATDTTYIVGASKRVAYDVRKAYTPIVQMTTQSYMLVMTPSLPIKSVKDLIAYAKAKPGALTYGSSGIGTTSHLGLERFDYMAGTKMLHVPYKGAAPAMLDIRSGQVDLLCDLPTTTSSAIRSGELRAFVLTASKRMASLADVPTADEVGMPGLHMSTWFGLYAPLGTPKPVLERLNKALREVVADKAVAEQLEKIETVLFPVDKATPEAHRAMLAAQIALWGPIIDKAGIQAE
jgi:tripartite-type tricarboxylate transporter receptor subunit TctC